MLNVNNIATDIVIEARNIETEELYSGKTFGVSSFICSYDLYRMCVDGNAVFQDRGNHKNSTMTAHYDATNDSISLNFRIDTYGISNLSFDAHLHPVVPAQSLYKEKIALINDRDSLGCQAV